MSSSPSSSSCSSSCSSNLFHPPSTHFSRHGTHHHTCSRHSSSMKLNADGFPQKQGLYDPAYEKDACGVGLIAQYKGIASHQLVRDGLEILKRMSHRGACGCDALSGDGAGVLVGISDGFFRRDLKQKLGVELPPFGKYAVGIVYLPRDYAERQRCKQHIESMIASQGFRFIVWRPVPTNNQNLGETSRKTEPCMEQLFIENIQTDVDEAAFVRHMYMTRRKITAAWKGEGKLYICSLSPRTIVYKGQLTPEQVDEYFIDFGQKDFTSHLILVHSRFSTNTFPSWERAQPFRCIAHNGEINTLKGNSNWMLSRQGIIKSFILGDDLSSIFPIIDPTTSDSGAFDNVVELLVNSGRSIEQSMLMMIPEPWQENENMSTIKKEFYEYHSALMEPWDGPALVSFTDGLKFGALLDRNGLRPGRYYVLNDDRVVLASEVGVLRSIRDSQVVEKGRLTPGEMFLIDFVEHRIIKDAEIKNRLSTAAPYGQWLKQNRIDLHNVVADEYKQKRASETSTEHPYMNGPKTTIMERLKVHGYTVESMNMLIGPMGTEAFESLGSMGNDQALPCLSHLPRQPFDYFQQTFAQVTNPPIDPIRESIVMTLACPIGPEGNLLESTSEHASRIFLEEPILSPQEFHTICHLPRPGWQPAYIDATWDRKEGEAGLAPAVKRICEEAEKSIVGGSKLIVITDKAMSSLRVPVSSLLAVGAVHQHLVRRALRSQVGIIVECGDSSEIHHHCLLVGFGADAIFPHVAYDACWKYQLDNESKKKLPLTKLVDNYKKSCHKGILKVMAKMGISTLQSYKGAQIFEALGIHQSVIDVCFTGCASRIGGSGFDVFAHDALSFHTHAFPTRTIGREDLATQVLRNPGDYHWRTGDQAEIHLNSPDAIAKLQEAAKSNSRKAFMEYSEISNALAEKCTLRGQFQIKSSTNRVSLDQVEPAKNIVKRFVTGAMSYGSISIEAHSTLAIAMNKIGGKSNTGEGGEHISRYEPSQDGQNTRSAIKQVASGRFGVTIHYLTNSDEIQIKMAQGAKPGEGGELPGYKVVGEIAKTRMSTEGVGLISPPPHHDIYSIEDLAQLIYDLKNANPNARISVKLVSEVGVGVVAAGVAKGKADHILISGHDGGTGASKWTGIKHAGLPWELGLAEAHQTLVLNGLRGRVILQTDGQLKTGLDVVKAACLGAEEFCFATAPLITLGCIMMRKCHLNTCPVGIATQDPELRRMFNGQPEHVINFFFLMAEEVRSYMAQMGVTKFEQLVGRADLLEPRKQTSLKTKGLDLSCILAPAHLMNPGVAVTNVETQDHNLDDILDRRIVKRIAFDLKLGKKVRADFRIVNTDRTVGTMLSYEVTKKFGYNGLPEDTIHLRFKGSAGQSFGAWLAPGICMELNGDANDYVGKGLSGGKLIVYPPKESTFKSEENVIAGNVCLYGATSGVAFFRGRALQRFAVRNSGANAVVEGVGDHGCEYMTGGTVVILGSVGRNFAAGMSGGIAFVYDPSQVLPEYLNRGLVQLEKLEEKEDVALLQSFIDQHRTYTGSAQADRILWNWSESLKHFVKVIPTEYKEVLAKAKAKEATIPRPPSPIQTKEPTIIGIDNKETTKQSTLAAPAAMNSNPITTLGKSTSGCGSCSCGAGGCSTDKNNQLSADDPDSALYEEMFEKDKKNTSGKDIEDLILEPHQHKPSCSQYKAPRPKSVPRPNKKRGFVEYERGSIGYRDASARASDFKEVYVEAIPQQLKTQASRCMDCGTPFCHQDSNGCPLGNKIPEWNDLVFKEQWRTALDRLLETNNFPEFTGRVCPAPCEGACVLGITEKPVTIKNMEVSIIDRAFKEGWMVPTPPKVRSGKRVAIIGSGPAGLAAADQLNKAGHLVTVYERSDRIGGLLMYGVPNMKLDKKKIVDRRVDLLRAEGIQFVCNVNVGVDVPASKMIKDYDSLILATGATRARDLPIPGRELNGIELAMNFLHPTTKSLLDSKFQDKKFINAKGKRVLVIGGGDTGNDCIGTAVRMGAKSVVNFELLPRPPRARASQNPWPQWPRIFRVEYGHEEVSAVYGSDPREFCVLSKKFLDDGKGNVAGVETVQIRWDKDDEGAWTMREVEGSRRVYEADLILLAMGFVGPETAISAELGVDLDRRGNYKAKFGHYATNVEKVWATGDCRRGQSLVVWAIAEGRQVAREVDKYLMGSTLLP